MSTGVYPGVFFPGDLGGLSPDHRTVAGELKGRNYSTYHIGKAGTTLQSMVISNNFS